ncbi:unnamed protein product, partial [Prorocentrum cordatum]
MLGLAVQADSMAGWGLASGPLEPTDELVYDRFGPSFSDKRFDWHCDDNQTGPRLASSDRRRLLHRPLHVRGWRPAAEGRRRRRGHGACCRGAHGRGRRRRADEEIPAGCRGGVPVQGSGAPGHAGDPRRAPLAAAALRATALRAGDVVSAGPWEPRGLPAAAAGRRLRLRA